MKDVIMQVPTSMGTTRLNMFVHTVCSPAQLQEASLRGGQDGSAHADKANVRSVLQLEALLALRAALKVGPGLATRQINAAHRSLAVTRKPVRLTNDTQAFLREANDTGMHSWSQ